jgi:heme-degrading monooxygenase HmoA
VILEAATLNVVPGEESAFERAFGEASPIIASMDGYLGHELQRCIEDRSKYLLLVAGDASMTTPTDSAAHRSTNDGGNCSTTSTTPSRPSNTSRR